MRPSDAFGSGLMGDGELLPGGVLDDSGFAQDIMFGLYLRCDVVSGDAGGMAGVGR